MIVVLLGVFIIFVLLIILIDLVELWKVLFVLFVVVNFVICLIYVNLVVNIFIYVGWNIEYRRMFCFVLVLFWKLMMCFFF